MSQGRLHQGQGHAGPCRLHPIRRCPRKIAIAAQTSRKKGCLPSLLNDSITYIYIYVNLTLLLNDTVAYYIYANLTLQLEAYYIYVNLTLLLDDTVYMLT